MKTIEITLNFLDVESITFLSDNFEITESSFYAEQRTEENLIIHKYHLKDLKSISLNTTS